MSEHIEGAGGGSPEPIVVAEVLLRRRVWRYGVLALVLGGLVAATVLSQVSLSGARSDIKALRTNVADLGRKLAGTESQLAATKGSLGRANDMIETCNATLAAGIRVVASLVEYIDAQNVGFSAAIDFDFFGAGAAAGSADAAYRAAVEWGDIFDDALPRTARKEAGAYSPKSSIEVCPLVMRAIATSTTTARIVPINHARSMSTTQPPPLPIR